MVRIDSVPLRTESDDLCRSSIDVATAAVAANSVARLLIRTED